MLRRCNKHSTSCSMSSVVQFGNLEVLAWFKKGSDFFLGKTSNKRAQLLTGLKLIQQELVKINSSLTIKLF